MSVTQTLFGQLDEIAMDRMRQFEPPEGYFLAFSGGKDSVVLYDLAVRSGVKFDAHYSVCPDPPELMRFIRKHYPGVKWETKPYGFFERMIQQRMPPLRNRRWCCREFKECAGDSRAVLTGVRWEESPARSKRRMVEACRNRKDTRYLSPIIDWSTEDIWTHIRSRGVPYCSLYDEGFRRLGCVGCPMGRDKKWYARWPNAYANWRRAFRVIWELSPKIQAAWSTSDKWFEAWLDRDSKMHGDLSDDGCGLFT